MGTVERLSKGRFLFSLFTLQVIVSNYRIILNFLTSGSDESLSCPWSPTLSSSRSAVAVNFGIRSKSNVQPEK